VAGRVVSGLLARRFTGRFPSTPKVPSVELFNLGGAVAVRLDARTVDDEQLVPVAVAVGTQGDDRGAASTRGDGDLQNIEQNAPGFAGSDADHAKSAFGERRDRQAQITTSRSTDLRGVLSTTNLA